MTNSETRERLPPAAIVATLLHHLPSIMGLTTASILHGSTPTPWLGSWVSLLIGGLLAVRILHPFATWLVFRFSVLPDGLAIRTGMIATRLRTVSWNDVSVVDVDRPWTYRLFGLVNVAVHAGGENDTTLRLAGITEATAASISECARRRGRRVDSRVDERDCGPSEVVYRANPRELMISSAAHGQFVVVGVGAVVFIMDLLDTLGIWDAAFGAAQVAPALWGTGAVMAVIIIGFALGMARNHRFTVVRSRDRLMISYGFLSRRERILDPGALIGGRVQRNVVEMLFDRVRVSLHSIDTSQQISSNLVLPSLPRHVSARILAGSFPELVTSRILTVPGRASVARALGIGAAETAIAAIAAILSLTLTPLSPVIAVLIGAVSLMIVARCVRVISARPRVEGECVLWSCRDLADRDDIIRGPAIHLVSLTSFGRGVVALVRVRFFAGVPRVLSAFSTAETFRMEASHLVSRTSQMTAVRGRAGQESTT